MIYRDRSTETFYQFTAFLFALVSSIACWIYMFIRWPVRSCRLVVELVRGK